MMKRKEMPLSSWLRQKPRVAVAEDHVVQVASAAEHPVVVQAADPVVAGADPVRTII